MPLNEHPFNRIAIVGAGLIGGSWGLALKRAGSQAHRIGCDFPEVLLRALAADAIDEAQPELARAVAGADLVILAAPVGAIRRCLPDVARAVPPNALVTDTGSTKVAICEEARRVFTAKALFMGGHPLAGKERSGVENADAALFEGTAYVLSPDPEDALADPRAKALADLVSRMGARVITMSAAEHDRAVAWLSHLPQLISTCLASLAGERDDLPLALAAAGFRDMTRLAESPFDVWHDICATNAANIQEALDALAAKLESLRGHLSDDSLRGEFEQAKRLRQGLRQSGSGSE